MTFQVLAVTAVAVYFLLRGSKRDNSEVSAMPIKKISPNAKMQRFAEAIARAEGFGIPGAIPTLANNPGDLVIPGWTGEKLGSEGISVFSSGEEGWQRLYNQLNLIVTGRSRVYNLDMTILQMGARYAPKDATNWARNVARFLQLSEYSSLREALT